MNAYSDIEKKQIFDTICEIIISGKSLRKAIDNVKISAPTFFEWIREDEVKSKQYARATVERAELMAEDMLDIADEAPKLTDTKFGTAVDNGDVQYKRLRVDTRKWALSKMMPKKYGHNPEEEKEKTNNDFGYLKLRDSMIDIYYRHLRKTDNILILAGGSRSGKTNNIIRDIVTGCAYRNEVWNIIAPSYKMLNKGSFIDIKDFIDEFGIDCKMPMNATDIRFPCGGSITFEVVISENEAKRNRDNVFINEADGIPEAIANLIIGRAKGRTIIDYNPTKKFWSEKYKTETNTLITTWLDNPYLSENQLEWFARLKRDGEFAELGSPERYVYDVYYCGNYSLLSGKAYELSDFDIRDKVPAKFDYMLSYSDPSLGVGADYFASLLFGIKGKDVWAVDCIFSQFTTTSGFIEQLKSWDSEYGAVDHYAEKNGTSGVVTKAAKEMYDGVLMEVSNPDKKEADIIVYSTTAKRFKFKRSQKMMNFINQCAEFPNSEHDDAPDCLGRGAKIIIKNFDL